MQAEGLRSAGARVQLACQRGSLRFFLRTGRPARRLSEAGVGALNQCTTHFVVDHELQLPGADLVFVHTLLKEASRYIERDDWSEALSRETEFFKALAPTTPIVANSQLVKRALVEHFGVLAERVRVHYPGYRSEQFDASRTAALRAEARRRLRIDELTPIIGLVTSGDFETRGLDIFLESAARIADVDQEARFLVVGSKRLPDWAAKHPLAVAGRVVHRAKTDRPELWMSALDVFLHSSRFETFGMVVSEAQALGVPVLTSRRVGAAECLPKEYASWLIEAPDAEAFAANVSRLLRDEDARRVLAMAGSRHIRAFDQHRYAKETAATILAQNR